MQFLTEQKLMTQPSEAVAQLFRARRFVAYANEHLVVLVGHHVGDAALFSRKDKDPPRLYEGIDDVDLQAIFRRGLHTVGTFVVSPGNFLLDPFKTARPAEVVLVGEADLPKWGGGVERYLAAFESARKQIFRFSEGKPKVGPKALRRVVGRSGDTPREGITRSDTGRGPEGAMHALPAPPAGARRGYG